MARALEIDNKWMREKVTQSEFDEFINYNRLTPAFIDDWSDDIEYCGRSYLQIFRGKNLSGLNMRCTDLRGMDLSGCNLRGANLEGTILSGACLHETDLRGANLCAAFLDGADLYAARIDGANLFGARLQGAINIPFIPMVCPESGEFTAYKKAVWHDGLSDDSVIVELRIPSYAKRSSAASNSLRYLFRDLTPMLQPSVRCDMAKVIKIYDLDRKPLHGVEAYSKYDETFAYIPGNMVSVCNFDENRWIECSTGIHFFMSFQEAVEY